MKTGTYDIAIAGGGLAGLSCALQARLAGYSVILIEKEKYPLHRVCGEYISNESWNYLLSLGLPLEEWKLPQINKLELTAPNGDRFESSLPLGGFGLSRYKLDFALAEKAREAGVVLMEGSRVEDITQVPGGFELKIAGQDIVHAKLCAAATGKRSNLDIRWQRAYLQKQDRKLENFIGVKYHVRSSQPAGIIGLHNFQDGYCGISAVEDDRYCLCYLSRADNLKACGNDIKRMQEEVLSKNPHLKKILSECEVLEGPLVISQVNFSAKTAVENGVLLLGDAAGMITPLCGNGMSIALHTGKIAAELMDECLQGKISVKDLEKAYTAAWSSQFGKRLKAGRVLQRFFGAARRTNNFIKLLKLVPFLSRPLIRMTHGSSF